MSCWYRLNQKPGLLTVASAPPPISCCLWTPSLSPLMHRNSSSPGSAPQTTCSPKLCPSFWPKPTSFLPFLFFKRKKKKSPFPLPTFWKHCVSPAVISSSFCPFLCSFQDAPHRKENDNVATFTQLSGHYLPRNTEKASASNMHVHPL